MDLLADGAELPGQQYLYLGMNVFGFVFHHEAAAFDLPEDVVQLLLQDLLFVLLEKADLCQHRYMSLGTQHIVSGKFEVKLAVVADSEVFHYLCG